MIKRLIILILTISLLFSLVSCLDIDENASSVSSNSDAHIKIPHQTIESNLNMEEGRDVYNNGVWAGKEGYCLSPYDYYQYSLLSDDEQVLYDKIILAIQTMQNIVDVSEMKISVDDGFAVVDKVLADNPQFFWVSRYTSIQRNSNNGNVVFIVLRYTDGIVTDVLDKNLNLTTKANRESIHLKINSFNTKIQEIVSLIPFDVSDVQKEKIIHDYICNNTVYDYTVLNNSDKNVIPHAYDIYGAIVEGKAVCEGYTKAFQYLCYCVGINATQICGVSDGVNHMWNAVEIDGTWYQIDLTLNDVDAEYIYYGYFNLSDSEMNEDHIPDNDSVSVPVCDGEKYEYADYYALNITRNGKKSTNHQFVAQNLVEENGQYLIVSIKNVTVTNDLLLNVIYDQNSAINNCAKSLGVTFNFEYTYMISGDLLYIPVIISKK